MRILEKIVFKQEKYPQVKKVIDDDQFARRNKYYNSSYQVST